MSNSTKELVPNTWAPSTMDDQYLLNTIVYIKMREQALATLPEQMRRAYRINGKTIAYWERTLMAEYLNRENEALTIQIEQLEKQLKEKQYQAQTPEELQVLIDSLYKQLLS